MKPKMERSTRSASKRKSAIPKKSQTAVSTKVFRKKVQKAISEDIIPDSLTNGLNIGGKKSKQPKNVESTTSVVIADKRKREQNPSVSKKDDNRTTAAASSKKNGGKSAKRPKVELLEVPELPSKVGTLFVIGDNDVGQLGLGQCVENKKKPGEVNLPSSIVDIASGGMHSVCLSTKGEVYTFGCNDEGALGRPTEKEGSEYEPAKVDIPEIVVQVSAGDSHTAALSETGQVYIWGNFRDGQGNMGLTPDGNKQPKPMKIMDGIKVVKIASGNEHLACLTNEGQVYTSGCGEAGQLGRISERTCKGGGRKGPGALLNPDLVYIKGGGKPIFIDDIWTGSYSTFIREKTSGDIYAFGLNNFNQLGFEGQLTKFYPQVVTSFNDKSWVQISGGQHHTLALDDKGCVYALGRKEYGRLGLGENCDDQNEPTIIPSLQGTECIDVSCGNIVSYAISEEGSIYSWGMGTNFQLGHGNEDDLHVPTVIAGNFASCEAFKVRGGGQHVLILAQKKNAEGKR